MSGGSLRDLIKKFGPFEECLIKNYLKQCLMALKYLHSKGIIYKNFFASNILVNEFGHIKLCDFTLSEKFNQNNLNLDNYYSNINEEIWSIGRFALELHSGKIFCKNYEEFYLKTRNLGDKFYLEDIKDNTSENLRNFIILCLSTYNEKVVNIDYLLINPFFD